MVVVSGLYRYPIKGLSAQPVRRERLVPGRPFPMDRVFALTRPDSSIDKDRPRWAKKGQFVMLMLDEGLAEVTTELDIDSLELTITRDGVELLRVNLGDRARHADVEAFFRRLVPRLHGTPRLVHAGDGHFMDKPDNVISLINLATVRSLERMWGVAIDPMRFRANIYIDGVAPWEEFGWIGAELGMGSARLAVDRRNGRCAATNVNPVTGQRDLDLPGSLRAEFGHKDLGVYLVVRGGGEVSVGDEISVVGVGGGQTASASPGAPAPGRRKYICGGCYYVYDPAIGAPAHGVAAGTAFGAIPHDWPCPDCGGRTNKFGPFRAR
jgi:GntR family transcriptional regulator/MocR family aminotransferase